MFTIEFKRLRNVNPEPLATGIGVSIAVGWIIVFGGIAYVASAFSARGAGSFLWRLLIGIVYILGGLYLAFNPGLALESLTLAMALMFFFEGVLETVVFFQFRTLPGSGWVLFDGLVTLFLAYLIWRPWPSSSIWAIGTILGINLITSGSPAYVLRGSTQNAGCDRLIPNKPAVCSVGGLFRKVWAQKHLGARAHLPGPAAIT